MEYYNPEHREPIKWASLAVLLYLVVLVVMMFTIRFAVAVTEPADQGILVDFGESADGAGEEELLATDVAATPPPPQPIEPKEEILTDDSSDVEVVEPQREEAPKQETPQEEQPIEQPDTVVVEPRVVNQNALFPGRKELSESTSQGTSSGAGNQGAESGAQGGTSEGGGSGSESFAQLKDRSIVGSLPKPSYAANNLSGVVVVDITVDDAGRVKSANYRATGSTTNNSQLVSAAENAARKARFTPSDEFIQSGTITYIFKIN